jgi:hypothetical protein
MTLPAPFPLPVERGRVVGRWKKEVRVWVVILDDPILEVG